MDPGAELTRRALAARLLPALAAAALLACGSEPEAAFEGDPGLSGRLWIDTRPPEAFAAGHHAGALNIQWGWDQLADRTPGYAPDPATPITVRSGTPDEARRAAALLAELGYRDVRVARDPEEPERLALMTARELRDELAGTDPPVVIDIRSPAEFESGTIPGALLVDEDDGARLAAELDPGQRYAIICEGGYRSSQLASWLRRHGFADVRNVIDGMAAWRRLAR